MDLRALIFMPALVGAVVFGFVFLLFLCHYYLTVLECTAAGGQEVPWVSEPVVDNVWKFVYLGFLIGVWLMPAIVAGRALTAGIDSTWVSLLGPLLVLWVCYPVSQLSSLSASSMWYPLVPDVFARLAQKPLVVLQFYALSAAVVAVFGVAFRWTFQTQEEWHLLFVGAPLLVVATLLYARLLGRLAFVLRFTKGLFPAKPKKKAKPAAGRGEPTADPKPKPRPKRRQPRELAPIDTPDGELSGYDVKFEDDAPPVSDNRSKAEKAKREEPTPEADPESDRRAARRRPTPESAVERGRVWTEEDDGEATAYGVREAEAVAGEQVPEGVMVPPAEEVRLLARTDTPRKPKRAWGVELLAFLGQPGTVSAVVIASGLCFLVGATIRVARAFNPAAGAG